MYPTGGRALDGRRLVLFFEKPLPADARLSYAAARNAQYGPHRRWGLEFAGLSDASGHQAPAFVLVPIAAAQKPVAVGTAPPAAELHDDWEQVAANCVGRHAAAVTAPTAEAGAAGWRQPYWNPASAGDSPNLFDSRGRVTAVGFHTGVWYMKPYYEKLNNADDALMASWCKNGAHGFTGLAPNGKYDLAVYLLQGPVKKDAAESTHSPVRVAALHLAAGKKKDARMVAERVVGVPATGTFGGYEVAGDGPDARGNVVVLRDVPADAHGRIELTVQVQERRGEQMRWADTTLAGVQLRPAAKR